LKLAVDQYGQYVQQVQAYLNTIDENLE
jgi:hypothetical protein